MVTNRDALRRAALSRRSALSRAQCESWSRSIQTRAVTLPHYLAAGIVVLYSAVQNEVGTQALLRHALGAGKRVYYPRLAQLQKTEFAQVSSEEEFVVGRFGIAEPSGSHLLDLEQGGSMIAFIPGVLFDRRGYRLGRGGGWYDRALAQIGARGLFIGLAYEFQVVEQVPEEPWDHPVDYIVTQNRLIQCGRQAGMGKIESSDS